MSIPGTRIPLEQALAEFRDARLETIRLRRERDATWLEYDRLTKAAAESWTAEEEARAALEQAILDGDA